jgi:hypothetical protein
MKSKENKGSYGNKTQNQREYQNTLNKYKMRKDTGKK